MQNWTRVLDPNDVLKPPSSEEMKSHQQKLNTLIDKLSMQQMEGQNLINDEEKKLKDYVREGNKLEKRINPHKKKTWTGSKNDPMVKEIKKLWVIDANIKRIKGNLIILKDRLHSLDMELKRLKQSLSDSDHLSYGTRAKYVGKKNLGTRRLKGGKRRKSHRKRRKRRKSRR